MAITCNWKSVMGYAEINGTKVTFYTGGNCTACICFEDENKNRILADFICDIEHLKRVLGKDGGHWKTDYSKIELNGFYKEAWQIAKELNKHDIIITIYRQEIKQ